MIIAFQHLKGYLKLTENFSSQKTGGNQLTLQKIVEQQEQQKARICKAAYVKC